jgi:hypothetical protein
MCVHKNKKKIMEMLKIHTLNCLDFMFAYNKFLLDFYVVVYKIPAEMVQNLVESMP